MIELFSSPEAWAALLTLTALEIVLGIDNVIFLSVLVARLPPDQAKRARQIGLALALVFRIALLSILVWLIGLTAPVVTAFGLALSWRDLILIGGGLFLLWKATKEIHHTVDPEPETDRPTGGSLGFGAAIGQILLLDLVFSVDSIITAVGMTEHVPVMMVAVVAAVVVMLVAAEPLSAFIARNPSVVMLALGFLIMIGMTLIAEGFGAHVQKGYVYTAMAFSAGVEGLNMLARRRRRPARDGVPASTGPARRA